MITADFSDSIDVYDYDNIKFVSPNDQAQFHCQGATTLFKLYGTPFFAILCPINSLSANGAKVYNIDVHNCNTAFEIGGNDTYINNVGVYNGDRSSTLDSAFELVQYGYNTQMVGTYNPPFPSNVNTS